jgi:hypothetical protein
MAVSGDLLIKQVPVSGTLEGDILRILNGPSPPHGDRAHGDHVPSAADRHGAGHLAGCAQTLAQLIAFRDKCGDKFVDEVSPGGEFIA